MKRDPTPALWQKSTFSNSQAACVEVAGLPGGRAVRDSKNPAGAVLTIDTAQWTAFTAAVGDGQFD